MNRPTRQACTKKGPPFNNPVLLWVTPVFRIGSSSFKIGSDVLVASVAIPMVTKLSSQRTILVQKESVCYAYQAIPI